MPQPRLHKDHAARQAAYRMRQEKARREQLRARGLPPLPPIASMPGRVRWQQAITQAARLLSDVIDEMQNYFDERSETWQESERAEEHQERMKAIQDALDSLEMAWT